MTHRLTPVVEKILIVNVIIFLVTKLPDFDIVDWLGLRYITSEAFMPHQLLTHLFVHAGFLHLFSNMVTLVTFGPVLEYTLSSKKFLALYLLTGIGAALLYMAVFYFEISKLTTRYHHYMAHPTPEAFITFLQKAPRLHSHYHAFVYDFSKHSEDGAYIARSKAIATQLYTYKLNMPVVGASGAIFGLLTAFALLFPTAILTLLFLPVPIKAKYFVILYGIYELYAGLKDNPTDNVAHFAHLGGIVFAYLFIKWYKRR